MIFIKIPKINENNTQLFIGDIDACMNKDILTNSNITHIINCASGIPCYFKNDFKYIQLYLHDDLDNILQHKNTILSFVKHCKEQNGNLLVHCVHAQSRSAAIVCLILMLENNINFDNAKNHLLRSHDRIDINTYYCKILKNLIVDTINN
jgi:dual specificity phosphatase 12